MVSEKHRESARQCLEGMSVAYKGTGGLRVAEDRIAEALANAEREGMRRAAEIAQRHVDQNDEQAKKLMVRSAKLRRIGDVFGHGALADEGIAEITAAQHEASAIASAILSEAGEA